MKIKKDFFTYFEGFDEIEVAKCVLNLDNNDKEIILSIWGENPTMSFNDKGQKVITLIKKKIGKKWLMHRLNCYDENLVFAFLKTLSIKDSKSILKEYYVTIPCPKEPITKEEISFNESLLSRVVLDNNVLLINHKSFYYAFKNYDEKDVKLVFNLLDENEKELIYKKYGKDFLYTNYACSLKKEDNITINRIIFPKMIKMLKMLKNSNTRVMIIEDIYPNISRGLLIYRISYLTEPDRLLLFNTFGNDLNKAAIITKNLYNELKNPRIIKVLENDDLKIIKVKKVDLDIFAIKEKSIRRLLNMDRAKKLINYYDEFTTLGIMIALYVDEEITDEEFYKITKKTRKEIYYLIKNDSVITENISNKKCEKMLSRGRKYEN